MLTREQVEAIAKDPSIAEWADIQALAEDWLDMQDTLANQSEVTANLLVDGDAEIERLRARLAALEYRTRREEE